MYRYRENNTNSSLNEPQSDAACRIMSDVVFISTLRLSEIVQLNNHKICGSVKLSNRRSTSDYLAAVLKALILYKLRWDVFLLNQRAPKSTLL